MRRSFETAAHPTHRSQSGKNTRHTHKHTQYAFPPVFYYLPRQDKTKSQADRQETNPSSLCFSLNAIPNFYVIK